MSTALCTRAWQAEALHDGRLAPADAASFQRHLATCETCQREVEALAQLKAAAERLPALTSTPLEHRRLRHAVLRSAHEASTEAPRAPKLAWLAALALTLAAAGAFLLWPQSASEPPRTQEIASDAPVYQQTASPDVVVHTLERGRVLRLALERGQLELSVTHLRPDQRFIVQLPDGELEVKGTRFIVHTDGLRTTNVRVFDGRVALRLRDRAPSLLEAGDAFTAPALERVEPEALPEPEPEPLLTKPRRSEPRASDEPGPRAPAATLDTPPPAESAFTRAMAAFSAGDFGHAGVLFEQFEREQPQDSRVEDAVFLRAVARARRGDEAGARAIARDYLARFPDGLRKSDAERLAR
jgi:ferric-dicitrate binding protein FerR (iron transport regulator)